MPVLRDFLTGYELLGVKHLLAEQLRREQLVFVDINVQFFHLLLLDS